MTINHLLNDVLHVSNMLFGENRKLETFVVISCLAEYSKYLQCLFLDSVGLIECFYFLNLDNSTKRKKDIDLLRCFKNAIF